MGRKFYESTLLPVDHCASGLEYIPGLQELVLAHSWNPVISE